MSVPAAIGNAIADALAPSVSNYRASIDPEQDLADDPGSEGKRSRLASEEQIQHET
jgi:hypothetical protein